MHATSSYCTEAKWNGTGATQVYACNRQLSQTGWDWGYTGTCMQHVVCCTEAKRNGTGTGAGQVNGGTIFMT